MYTSAEAFPPECLAHLAQRWSVGQRERHRDIADVAGSVVSVLHSCTFAAAQCALGVLQMKCREQSLKEVVQTFAVAPRFTTPGHAATSLRQLYERPEQRSTRAAQAHNEASTIFRYRPLFFVDISAKQSLVVALVDRQAC